MIEVSQNELKNIELNLLKVFDAFCKENNITYFLSNGTLLGAVKYNGHIPWDDDIDVFLPRKDYNKLLEIFRDDERYKLFAFERNSEYRYPFAKFCDMTTRKVETHINNRIDLGIDVDVFPLDLWNPDLKKAKREVKRINRCIFFLGLSKVDGAYSRTFAKRIIKAVLRAYCVLRGSKHYVQSIVKHSTNVTKDSGYIGCKSWCIYGEREIIPKEVFSGVTEVEFEGYTFPAPIGYDTYLRCMYGDYEKDPPKEKQKTHHDFKAYKL